MCLMEAVRPDVDSYLLNRILRHLKKICPLLGALSGRAVMRKLSVSHWQCCGGPRRSSTAFTMSELAIYHSLRRRIRLEGGRMRDG